MKGTLTDAIILRWTEYSESSLIVQLFTAKFGRVAALARGVRRLQRYRAAALDQLCISRILLRRRSNRGLDLLHEAVRLEGFEPLGLSHRRTLAGFLVARLLLDFLPLGQPQPILYDRACQTLRAIRLDTRWELRTHRFIWELIALAGYEPRWDRCGRCRRALKPGEPVKFCPLAGGVVCGRCRPLSRVATPLKPQTVPLLRRLAPWSSRDWPSLRLDAAAHRSLWRVEGAAVRAITEQPVRLIDRLAQTAGGRVAPSLRQN